MEVQTLYDFIFSLTKSYENAVDRTSLINGLKESLSLFFKIENLKIFLMDEYSFLLKDFEKPWESLVSSKENDKIKIYFDDFLIKKNSYFLIDNQVYFPIIKKNKTLGLVQISVRDKISGYEEFFKILPLVQAQISMLITTLKNSEAIKLSSKFHQTVRNIAKITETQYELDYILPIMGEMIDSFIYEHLIYIFIKSKNKKDYKLIWPNKCSDDKIYEYLETFSQDQLEAELAHLKDLDEGKKNCNHTRSAVADLSQREIQVVRSYREQNDAIKNAIDKILDLEFLE